LLVPPDVTNKQPKLPATSAGHALQKRHVNAIMERLALLDTQPLILISTLGAVLVVSPAHLLAM